MTVMPAAARKISVVIVAASAARRRWLRSLLSAYAEIEIASDNNLSGGTPQSVTIIDAGPHHDLLADDFRSRAGLVVLSNSQDLNWIAHTFPKEPVALLSRDCAGEQLMMAIRAVSAGLTVLEPETLETLLRGLPESIALEPGEDELTSRETEVLQMMTAGLTNREIAAALRISENTVKFHAAAIFGKLGTSTRTEAVTEGLRRGLIML